MLKYSISIRWSDEDNGFIATVPEMPGLSAFGKNQSKALSELKIAAQAYIKSLRKSEKPDPIIEKISSHSGQIRLRMPKSLHGNLADSAKKENISLNTYIVTLLSKRNMEQEILKRVTDLQRDFWTINYNIVSYADNKAQLLLPAAPPTTATQQNINGRRSN
jgi:predicted RNase H-like HicB family nuclease